MPESDHTRYEDFVRLLLQHETRVRAFLHTQLGSWDEVDDAMQETSLVAWRKHAQFEPGTSFLNWLLTIARFEALNHRRRQARSRLMLSSEVLDLIADEGMAEAESLERESHALDHCLDQLSSAQRELLRVAYQPGVKFNDVAVETGRSVEALYKTIQRLRAALLLCVEKQLRETQVMSIERLDELLLHWSQGTLTDGDAAELNTELQANADARHRLRRHATLDAELRARSIPPSASAWTPPASVAPKQKRPFLLAVMTACFASLLCMVAFVMGGRHTKTTLAPEETNLGCAILTRTVDASWTGTRARSGDTLNAGTLHLDKGLAQIEFFSGATLLLEGSAELEIISPWEAVCRSGKARVHVPPPAHGFKLLAPGMKLVDLGTEFGLTVQADGRSEVQVFEGEVEAHPDSGPQVNLKEGHGLQTQSGTLSPLASVRSSDFVDMAKIEELGSAHEHQRFTEWQAWSQHMRADPRLIAYYPFRHFRQDKWDRLVDNAAEPIDKNRAGGAVGAAWTEGRWPEKDAIEFKRPGDRVRMQIDGTYTALTLACWVRIDGLDRRYNALLLTDGYDPGEPHWQVYEDGRLMFSVMYRDAQGANHNQIYFSPVIFNRSNTGRWHHVAVTYDNQSGAAVQYVDGREVSREPSPLHQPGRPLVFGPCEIGNWGLPTTGHQFPIRNLNGAIDEFTLYKAALTPAEIQAVYEAGKPQ